MTTTIELRAAEQWRDLALQFDGHRIEALSLLRYVALAENCAEAVGRIGEIKAFLAKPPLSGEAVLAQRLNAIFAVPAMDGRVLQMRTMLPSRRWTGWQDIPAPGVEAQFRVLTPAGL